MSSNTQDSTTIGPSAAGLGFQSVCVAGGSAFIYNSQDNSIAIGNDVNMGPTGTEGICIGHNSGCTGVDACIAIGSGAFNDQAHSCLLGDSGILNIRPNSSICTLGTAASPFAAIYAGSGGLVRSTLFSQYSSVTVNNTASDTSVLTGSHVGSLTLAAGQTAGTAVSMTLYFTEATATGHFNFNIKVDGSTVLTSGNISTAGPALGVFTAMFVITSSNLRGYCSETITGVAASMTDALTITYDKSLAHTWDVSAVWSAANSGNVLSVDLATVDILAAS